MSTEQACSGGAVGSVAVRAAWLRRLASLGYSGVCFEIKFSGRHRGFDESLFNL